MIRLRGYLGVTLLIAICIMSLLLLAGCGQKSVSEQQGDKTASAGVIELKLHHHQTPVSNAHQAFEEWARKVGEATGGKVKISIYPAETLGKARDAYDMVLSDIVDIAWGVTGNFPGVFPLSEVAMLPCTGIPDNVTAAKVMWDLYTTTDYLKPEYSKVKVLALYADFQGDLGTTKKPIQTLEDLKGMRIRTIGGPPMEFFKAAGASPTLIPAPDIFESLQRGVIDGYIFSWEGVGGFRLWEPVRYHTNYPLYGATLWVVMNLDKWNSLPPNIQQAIDSVSGLELGKLLASAHDKGGRETMERAKADGDRITELSAEEQARWEKLARGVWDKWVADMEGKGLPGKATLRAYLERVEKYTGKRISYE